MKLSELLKKRNDITGELGKLREDLSKRQADMGSAILAGKDPVKIAGEIRDIEARIYALESADKATAQAAGDLGKQEAEAEETRRIKTLREQEEAAYLAAVDALVELGDKLDALDEVHRKVTPWSRCSLPSLAYVVRAELDRLRRCQPQFLGLPPLPTREEIHKREASHDVERLRGVVEGLKKEWNRTGEKYVQHLLEGAEAGLRAAEARAK
jgi:hypothetical protein